MINLARGRPGRQAIFHYQLAKLDFSKLSGQQTSMEEGSLSERNEEEFVILAEPRYEEQKEQKPEEVTLDASSDRHVRLNYRCQSHQ
jgi:hypothetical protein